MLEAVTGGYKTKVSVNGSTLVLSTPDALSPGVWRLDLLETKECIFEVEENKKAKSYDLVKKTGTGAKKLIASYDERPKAMQALIKVTKALENAGAAANNNVCFEKKRGFPWLKILLILIFGYIAVSIFVVTGPLMRLGPPPAPNSSAAISAPASSQGQGAISNTPASQSQAPGEVGVGVPMSAEDFLN